MEHAVEAADSSPEYSLSAERRVPQDHPLRAMRAMAAAALQQFGEGYDAIYASSRHGLHPLRHMVCNLQRTILQYAPMRRILNSLNAGVLASRPWTGG